MANQDYIDEKWQDAIEIGFNKYQGKIEIDIGVSKGPEHKVNFQS